MTGKLPANLNADALALSPAECKTFPRWYTDLLLRGQTDGVTIGDVLRFLDNFGVSEENKREISSIFGENLVVLEPVQFYIFLRLAGHLLQGKRLRIELAFVAAPVPHPRSILATKKPKKTSNTNDMDSFMSLMTGSGVTKKRKKRVTFDSKPPQVKEAAQRSMQELLRQLNVTNGTEFRVTEPQPQLSAPIRTEPEKDEPDQPIIDNHFAHVNIDTVLQNGQSILPKPPAPRGSSGSSGTAGDSFINQLTSNAVQPGQTQSQQSTRPPPPPQRMASQDNVRRQQLGTAQLSTESISPQGSGFQNQVRQKLPAQSTGSLPITLQPYQAQITQHDTGSQLQSSIQPQSSGIQQPVMQPQTSGVSQPSGMQLQTPNVQSQPSGAQFLSMQSSGTLPISATGSLPIQNSGLSMQNSGLSMQGSGQRLPMQGSGTSQNMGQIGQNQLGQFNQVISSGQLHPSLSQFQLNGMQPAMTPMQPQQQQQMMIQQQMMPISSGHLHPPFNASMMQPPQPPHRGSYSMPGNMPGNMQGNMPGTMQSNMQGMQNNMQGMQNNMQNNMQNTQAYVSPQTNNAQLPPPPPMQRGMDFINSVQFSNNPAYNQNAGNQNPNANQTYGSY